jgi:hypothetical protein
MTEISAQKKFPVNVKCMQLMQELPVNLHQVLKSNVTPVYFFCSLLLCDSAQG